VVQATTTTLCSTGRTTVESTTPTSSYGRHGARERPQAALAASAPPLEPPEQPHIEGEAATKEIERDGCKGLKAVALKLAGREKRIR
jgi:hypothetical protein